VSEVLPLMDHRNALIKRLCIVQKIVASPSIVINTSSGERLLKVADSSDVRVDKS
jgi:hypothetical protein